MMKERSSTLAQNSNSEPDAKQDQSKKIFERLVDDKVFFFDEDNAYIMNWIDTSECLQIQKDESENSMNLLSNVPYSQKF